MKNKKIFALVLSVMTFALSCTKSDFLDAKPNKSILIANTIEDFRNLMENTSIVNVTGGALAQMSGDEYVITSYAEWQGLSTSTQKNAYIWAPDLYAGENTIQDWNVPYKTVFYANAVLDGLEKSAEGQTAGAQSLKGRALFVRANAFYDLARNFCKAYDPVTADTDPGVPLKLTSAVENTESRSSLKQTYDRIVADLNAAETLLPPERQPANLNRPSKIAVYALMSRIFLEMRRYGEAEQYADRCMSLYSTLIDYSTLNRTATSPFNTGNEEVIYNTLQATFAFELTGASNNSVAKISPEVIGLYAPNDLRLQIFFTLNAANGTYTKKRGYYGLYSYPFTGLATDEVYLIKAECSARRGDIASAMSRLNQLASKRWNPGATSPARPYVDLTASTPGEALQKVLTERRKELVWRGMRWHDLKRLNMEGAGIALSRTLNGITYTLPANDARWVFPIPLEEISASGIVQNPR